jgi:hypothetical protein
MKNVHFLLAIFQFVGMGFANMIESKLLFYWCAFWMVYEIYMYVSHKEEK